MYIIKVKDGYVLEDRDNVVNSNPKITMDINKAQLFKNESKVYSFVDFLNELHSFKVIKVKIKINAISEYEITENKEELIKEIKKVSKQIGLIFEDKIGDCANCKDCCCRDCNKYIGHFQCYYGCYYDGEGKDERFEELKRKYGFNKNGFLGKRGCRLPRYLRSITCLGYNCLKLGLSQSEKRKLNGLIKKIKFLRKKAGLLN